MMRGLVLWGAAVSVVLATGRCGAMPGRHFGMTEYFGRTWASDLVQREITAAPGEKWSADKASVAGLRLLRNG